MCDSIKSVFTSFCPSLYAFLHLLSKRTRKGRMDKGFDFAKYSSRKLTFTHGRSSAVFPNKSITAHFNRRTLS
jgi:hypothetical protein